MGDTGSVGNRPTFEGNRSLVFDCSRVRTSQVSINRSEAAPQGVWTAQALSWSHARELGQCLRGRQEPALCLGQQKQLMHPHPTAEQCSRCPRPIWSVSGALPAPRILLKVPGFCSPLPARITERFGLEGTLKHTQFQPPARDRGGTTRSGCTRPHPTLVGSHNYLTPLSPGIPTGSSCPRIGNLP